MKLTNKHTNKQTNKQTNNNTTSILLFIGTVHEWIIEYPTDPLLALANLGGQSFLCQARPTSADALHDECNTGRITVRTGKSDGAQFSNYYVADRGMHGVPALGDAFCAPFKSCGAASGAYLDDYVVYGDAATHHGIGDIENLYGWRSHVDKDTAIDVWSDTLFRRVSMEYSGETSVARMKTLRYRLPIRGNGAATSAAEDANAALFFNSINGVHNQTSYYGGVPLFSMPAMLEAAVTQHTELAHLLANLDVTLLDGCRVSGAAGVDAATCGDASALAYDRDAYSTLMDVEPVTGLSLRLHERLTPFVLMPAQGAAGGDYAALQQTMYPVFSADKHGALNTQSKGVDKLQQASMGPTLVVLMAISGPLMNLMALIVFPLCLYYTRCCACVRRGGKRCCGKLCPCCTCAHRAHPHDTESGCGFNRAPLLKGNGAATSSVSGAAVAASEPWRSNVYTLEADDPAYAVEMQNKVHSYNTQI
jgi:hypothetical protein